MESVYAKNYVHWFKLLLSYRRRPRQHFWDMWWW